VKLLVRRPDLLALRNQAFVYTGDTMDTYVTGYTEDEWCLSHDSYTSLVDVFDARRLADLLDRPEWVGGADAVELEAEMVVSRRCLACGWEDSTMGPLGLLGEGDGECPECETELTISAARTFEPADSVMQTPLAELRLFNNDVVTIRSSNQRHHYVLRSAR
jgi:hypothetical protein